LIVAIPAPLSVYDRHICSLNKQLDECERAQSDSENRLPLFRIML